MRLALVQPSRWHRDGHANLAAAHEAIGRQGPGGDPLVVVLPELIGGDLADADYVAHLRQIAVSAEAWVVGGSHHRRTGRSISNCGAVVDPHGEVVARYAKATPFGSERTDGVEPGPPGVTVRIAGCDVAVLICADAWFAEHLLALEPSPDLVIVTSFSVTRRDPAAARRLWHHLAVSRAYEFGAYVAVADWRAGARYRGVRAAGASGLAEPEPHRLGDHFSSAGDADVWVRDLDLARLREHRRDRAALGLFRGVL